MKSLMFAISVVLLVVSAPLTANAEKASEANIRKLLEVTKALETSTKMLPAMSKMVGDLLKQARPDIPSPSLDYFRKKFDAGMIKALPELLSAQVIIYQRHFTDAEVFDLLAFYSTPTGKKLIETQPILMAEGMQAGQIWGKTVAQRLNKKIVDDMMEKGIPL